MSENKQQTILIPNRETSESQLYSPFGPLIGYKKLSDELVNILNEGVDNHEKGSETLEDHSDYLVGKIQEELTFSEHHVAATMRELIPFIKEYLVASKSRELMVPATLGKDTDINVAVDGAWFVRSFAGDFNPIHTHTDCLLSCIGYLNIPEELEKEWENDKGFPCVGLTQFVFGAPTDSFYAPCHFFIKPKVGDFYLFPASLQHMVYPFKSKGERRSFSMNFIFNLIDKKNKVLTKPQKVLGEYGEV